jgi:hypothetical protein
MLFHISLQIETDSFNKSELLKEISLSQGPKKVNISSNFLPTESVYTAVQNEAKSNISLQKFQTLSAWLFYLKSKPRETSV